MTGEVGDVEPAKLSVFRYLAPRLSRGCRATAGPARRRGTSEKRDPAFSAGARNTIRDCCRRPRSLRSNVSSSRRSRDEPPTTTSRFRRCSRSFHQRGPSSSAVRSRICRAVSWPETAPASKPRRTTANETPSYRASTTPLEKYFSASRSTNPHSCRQRALLEPPVPNHQHTVARLGDPLGTGHDDERHGAIDTAPRKRARISAPPALSRLPVGSSASTSFGRMTRARRSRPLLLASRHLVGPVPGPVRTSTASSAARARRSIFFRGTRSARSGYATSSRAVIVAAGGRTGREADVAPPKTVAAFASSAPSTGPRRHLAAAGTIEAGDDLEQGGFARAVGPVTATIVPALTRKESA